MRYCWFVIFALIPILGHATKPAPPAIIVPPALRTPDLAPIEIREADIQVRIAGFIAETAMTLHIYNPNGRPLEGDFYFPLPPGATVSGYALDVNNAMVDAVAVAKEKARIVFEKEVRKGIDPAIVEWTQGNHFHTRIFPIPAQGRRIITIRYVDTLVAKPTGASYRLPLWFKSKLDKAKLRIDVLRNQEKPVVEWQGPQQIEFQNQDQGFFAQTELAGQALTGTIHVRVPHRAGERVWVERNGHGETVFAAYLFPPDLPAAPAAAPKKIKIIWDASDSRAAQDHAKELALLKAYLAQFTSSTLTVELYLLRNTLEHFQTLTVKNGDSRGLVQLIEAIDYDGGTQMGAIRDADSSADLYLLFADGLSTFGKATPAKLPAPVYVIKHAVNANPGLLQWLAQQSGGAYVDLDQADVESAVAILNSQPVRVAALFDDWALEDVHYNAYQPGQALVVTGKLKVPQAVLRMRLTRGAQSRELSQTIAGTDAPSTGETESQAKSARPPAHLVTRLWAQQKLQDMLVFAEGNDAALVALGQRYQLVTPRTSLIVLERLEQYVEHEIEPPASLPAMRAQYRKRLAQRADQAKERQASKLEQLVQLWQARKKWWATKFTYRPKEKKKAQRRSELSAADGVAELAAPPPVVRNQPAQEATVARPRPDAAAPMDVMARFSSGAESERPAAKAKAGADADAGAARSAAIQLHPWQPDAAYLKTLAQAPVEQRFATYMRLKAQHRDSPSFFFDCAHFFQQHKQTALAVQILSNVAETRIDDERLLRVLAYRLKEYGAADLAIVHFERILALKQEEPQSFRDLALVLAEQKDYARAMSLLAHVVMNDWDRFAEIELIALMELNRIIPLARAAGVKDIPLDPRLIALLDLDIRIVVSWDADLTDIDLWVTEPTGEQAYYGNNRTGIGGLVSRDFTAGYGPEEYLLHHAPKGDYKVSVKYFGDNSRRLTGPVTLQLQMYTNYGRPNEAVQTLSVRLTDVKEVIDIGVLSFK